jgi:long-chain acyl-CoA synthetase
MALHIGGTVIFTDSHNFFRDCERFNQIYVFLMIFDVQKLVSGVPRNFRRPSACYLQTVGGILPAVLRAKAKQAFASEIDVNYGANETTLISVVDENGIGTLMPDVEAVIVDEFNREKPYGETGRIKLRGDGMVNGYLQDPELTAAWFVDGWFRSSDIGYMPEPGKLVVLGRAGDMLNIGGSKISPHSLAERARQIAGVRDIALAAVSNTNGIGEIAAAVEIKESSDRNFIRVQLQKILPSHLGPIHVMFTGALPRTENGKIRMRDVEERLQTVFGGDSTQRP